MGVVWCDEETTSESFAPFVQSQTHNSITNKIATNLTVLNDFFLGPTAAAPPAPSTAGAEIAAMLGAKGLPGLSTAVAAAVGVVVVVVVGLMALRSRGSRLMALWAVGPLWGVARRLLPRDLSL